MNIFLVNREHVDLEKKHRQLLKENSSLQSQARDKDDKLHKLRTGTYILGKSLMKILIVYDCLFQCRKLFARNMNNLNGSMM